MTPELVRLRDIVVVVRHRARTFGLILGATVVVAAGLSLLLPVWYTSSSLFSIEVAPQLSTTGGGVLNLASQLGFTGLGGGSYSPAYYADVLTSNQVLDAVALDPVALDSSGRAELLFAKQPAETPRERDKARKRMQRHFQWSVDNRTGTLSFTIEARSPYAAQAAADTILAALNRTIIQLRRQRATAERRFLEARLDSALVRQTEAENALRTFYSRNRIVNSPDLQFEEARLKRVADFAVEFASQLRVQLEQARLQEVRDTPALSLIANPEIPGRKSRPNRRLMVLAAALSVSLLLLGWAAVEAVISGQAAAIQGQGHPDR